MTGIILVVVFRGKAKEWATDVFKNIYIENYQDDEEGVGDFFQEKVLYVGHSINIGNYSITCVGHAINTGYFLIFCKI